MALALLCKQSHRLIFNSIRISGKQILQSRTIFSNINCNSRIITSKQNTRCFSLTEPRYSGDHGAHWKIEIYISGLLLGLFPAAFIFPSATIEYVLITFVVSHYYMAVDSIISDYIRPIIFGHTFPKIARVVFTLFSLSVFAGLINLTKTDIGFVKAVKLFWSLKGYDGEDSDRDHDCGCVEK